MTDQEQLCRVHVDLKDRGYDVVVGPGSLASLGQSLASISSSGRAVLIADQRVVDAGLHRQAVRSCEIAGVQLVMLTVPEGEGTKSIGQAERLYSELVGHRIERGTPLAVLGGGVTGDLAGFVAATYLRGIPFLQCPTTLLSMVDSSVGGKVAVNLPAGKNLVGAFYQPRVVIIDTAALASLPLRELRCGLAECIKHGLGLDAALYEWTESNISGILTGSCGSSFLPQSDARRSSRMSRRKQSVRPGSTLGNVEHPQRNMPVPLGKMPQMPHSDFYARLVRSFQHLAP
jgi:3-dehydroquinate synthetase